MIRHNQQFLFITVLHVPCSGAAFYDAFTFQHRSDCSENASHIHKHIQMSHIIAIESCFFTYFQLISSMNLCPSCQSRADIICSIFIAFFQKIILIPECRSWPDYRHISLKNIQKLWQFIQTGFSKPPACSGQILFRICQQMGRHVMWSIGLHTSKFVKHKMTLVDSYPLLLKKYRCSNSIFQLDCNCNTGKYR